jgi:hypothetical protein
VWWVVFGNVPKVTTPFFNWAPEYLKILILPYPFPRWCDFLVLPLLFVPLFLLFSKWGVEDPPEGEDKAIRVGVFGVLALAYASGALHFVAELLSLFGIIAAVIFIALIIFIIAAMWAYKIFFLPTQRFIRYLNGGSGKAPTTSS